MCPPYWMVFDVESIGLHGEGFAVGWVVIDRYGHEIEADIACCPLTAAEGEDVDRAWVREHVAPHLPEPTDLSPRAVREDFWLAWQQWKERGALLAADVAWPVEARFLAACVNDYRAGRAWDGPYPLVDVASIRLAAGLDSLATVPRLRSEEPAHNPLADARQSARLLLEALGRPTESG